MAIARNTEYNEFVRLQFIPFHLRELDLAEKELPDPAINLLLDFLLNPRCKLEILSMRTCRLSEINFNSLALALKYNPSHLRKLDLSHNKLQHSAVKLLSDFLLNPLCQLETLSLRDCSLSEISCGSLGSALMSNPSHLTELDLSENNLQDSEVKISEFLLNPLCKLESLSLRNCRLSETSCDWLASSLRSNPSHLRELDLSMNSLRDSGVKTLCSGLENPNCKLEALRLGDCWFSELSCDSLVTALKINSQIRQLVKRILGGQRQMAINRPGTTAYPSSLRELDLSLNYLQNSGVKLLCDFLLNPLCNLEVLSLFRCSLSKVSCASLASTLKFTPSYLRELDLSWNDLQDSGVRLLCSGLRSQNCRLEALRLDHCWLSKTSCGFLALALKCDPSYLRFLDLSENDIQDSGVKLFCNLLQNPLCKLDTLGLLGCSLSKISDGFLASALKSNPSHLRVLDLRGNDLQDSDLKLLLDLLKNPNYKLETLGSRLY